MFELGGILGAAGAIGKGIFGLHQNHLANQIHPEYNKYQESPYAKAQLGLGQQLFNGRMAGAGAMEQNIGASQANSYANIGRNATDSGQALSLGGLAQGQSNDAYGNLQIKEAQNKYGLLNNLNRGYEGMVGEGDKVYADMLQKYQMDTQQKAALKNSAWQNIFGAASDLSSGAMQMGQMMGGGQQGGGQQGGGGIASMLPMLLGL